MKKNFLYFLGKIFKRCVDIYFIMPAQGIKHLLEVDGMTVCPGGNGSLPERDGGIRNNHVRVKISFCAESVTFRAGALGIVEGEHLRCQFRDTNTTFHTSGFLAEKGLACADHIQKGLSFSHAEGQFHGIRKTPLHPFIDYQTIYDHTDGMFLVFSQVNIFIQHPDLIVYLDPCEPISSKSLNEVSMFPFFPIYQRGQDLQPGAFIHTHDPVHDLLCGLRGNLFTTVRTMGVADPGKEESQEVVYFGNGSHGGAGIATRGSLLDCYGRRKPLYGINVRLVHLLQKLTGVC